MTSPAPRVSVITPCYNNARFIGETIESVLVQSLGDLEHVVVDDGSSDGSADIVAGYAGRDPRVRLVRQANRGASEARNAGFAAASEGSDYLWFLDSDDCLEPDALATMTDYLDDHPDAGLVYCGLRVVDTEGVVQEGKGGYSFGHRYVPGFPFPRRLPDDEPETPFHSLFAYYLAIPSTCLMRRSVYERTAGWDEQFRRAMDKDMILQMAIEAPVHLLPQTLVRYRRHDSNLSGPTVYKKLKPVHDKWWRGEHLTPEQRRLARSAVVFDQRLAAFLQLRAAWDSITSGRPLSTLGHLLSAGKRTAVGTALFARSLIERGSGPRVALEDRPSASGGRTA
jgi:glycosyltransferase involved in cell wall biosynthesis